MPQLQIVQHCCTDVQNVVVPLHANAEVPLAIVVPPDTADQLYVPGEPCQERETQAEVEGLAGCTIVPVATVVPLCVTVTVASLVNPVAQNFWHISPGGFEAGAGSETTNFV